MKRKLWCTGFSGFKKIVQQENWENELPMNVAVISILNGKDCGVPNEEHLLKSSEQVLNLDFDDSCPNDFGLPDDYENIRYTEETTLEFFTEFQARELIDFVENNLGRDFYIHCSAGVSRSQAVVKFIQNNYSDRIEWQLNPNNPVLFPNWFVYQKLNKIKREREETYEE